MPYKKIINVFIGGLLGIFIICTAVEAHRANKYFRQYEQLDRQLRESTGQLEQYKLSVADRLRQAGECIRSANGSVQDLRAGLRRLQEIITDLETSCYNDIVNCDNNDSIEHYNSHYE